MTVTVKNREPLVVPLAVRRQAGLKGGDELEFKVAGGVITIVPISPADEVEDSLEVLDAKVGAHIRASHAEFLAGRSRPAETFLAQRVSREKGRRGGKRHPRL